MKYMRREISRRSACSVNDLHGTKGKLITIKTKDLERERERERESSYIPQRGSWLY